MKISIKKIQYYRGEVEKKVLLFNRKKIIEECGFDKNVNDHYFYKGIGEIILSKIKKELGVSLFFSGDSFYISPSPQEKGTLLYHNFVQKEGFSSEEYVNLTNNVAYSNISENVCVFLGKDGLVYTSERLGNLSAMKAGREFSAKSKLLTEILIESDFVVQCTYND